MIEVLADTVVVDTDVFSLVYVKERAVRGRRDVGRLEDMLRGRTIAIASQTRAELLSWPLTRNWSIERTHGLHEMLQRTLTVPTRNDVADAYAFLTAECRRQGHALAQKAHVGDRWVAATAITLAAPLLALDSIYQRTPRLTLLG